MKGRSDQKKRKGAKRPDRRPARERYRTSGRMQTNKIRKIERHIARHPRDNQAVVALDHALGSYP